MILLHVLSFLFLPFPVNMQAIKMETEKLRGAEEADYNLMEKIIERRLRRDSTDNRAESLDELAVKSVMESEMTFEPGTAYNGEF